MKFRSEVSSCASRPNEAMVSIHDHESGKSIANLKNVLFCHWGQVADKLRGSCVLYKSECLKEIINGDFKGKVFIHADLAKK